MAEKRILYHFNRAPHGNIFWTEGMRAATGAVAGIDEHKVDLLFQGDGVYNALKDMEETESLGYLPSLEEAEAGYYVVDEDIKERVIGVGDLKDRFKVIDRAKAAALYLQTDMNVDW
ncbi:MAG: DsrE family protein [Actinomycetota bacterium]|nr:DsrE family protein [Actinomycetota bacterium]